MNIQHLLAIRPARAEDRAAVTAMVATVWNGNDYIPHMWDELLHDPDGPLLVGELDSQLVALAKLTALGPGEDWFEALRIDPALRGRGLARQMLAHCVALSRERGAHTLRFITSEGNATVHRMAAEQGFELLYAPKWAGAPLSYGMPDLATLAASDAPRTLADLERSALLRLTGGTYTYEWTTAALSEARLREHLQAGEVVALPGSNAWAIVPSGEEINGRWIAHAEGSAADLATLFQELQKAPTPTASELLCAQAPADSVLFAAVLAAGLRPDKERDRDARVFELRFETSSG